MSKAPLDSQHAALLLEDKFRDKDNGEICIITALLHISASLNCLGYMSITAQLPGKKKRYEYFLSHFLWLLAKSLHAISTWISRLSVLLMFLYVPHLSAFSKVFGV